MRRMAGDISPERVVPRRTLLVPTAGDTVRLLAPQLGVVGYEVAYVSDVLAALARLPRCGHGTVLMEMGTRRTVALETCRAIRRMCNLPVIVVTRPDAQEERIAALE